MAARRGNHGFSLVSQRLRASRRAVCGVCRFHWGIRHQWVAGALRGAGGGLASNIRWTTPAHPPLTVRLLQGNIEQSLKFERAGIHAALTQYIKLITARPADLIVTRAADGAAGLTNSVFGLTPHSRRLYQYDKAHLVPLGEFIPWGFRWFVQQMHIPLGDFMRGPAVQAPFTVHPQRLAPSICYEDVFGEEIARTLREAPAGILLNATNSAWFGKALVLDQHLQIARMRALETGRRVLRATNTGITAIIGADGRVVRRLPAFTVGALEARVQGVAGLTPYIRSGNRPALCVSWILLAFYAGRRMVKRVSR